MKPGCTMRVGAELRRSREPLEHREAAPVPASALYKRSLPDPGGYRLRSSRETGKCYQRHPERPLSQFPVDAGSIQFYGTFRVSLYKSAFA